MQNLTKNHRSWYVILKDDRQFWITDEQYKTIFLADQDWKYNDSLIIKDCDTNEIVYNGKIWAIKEYKQIKKSTGWIHYFCDFWISHELRGKCECADKFDVNWWEFKYQARKLFWKQYMQDLTESERVMTLKYCKKRFHTSQENK